VDVTTGRSNTGKFLKEETKKKKQRVTGVWGGGNGGGGGQKKKKGKQTCIHRGGKALTREGGKSGWGKVELPQGSSNSFS